METSLPTRLLVPLAAAVDVRQVGAKAATLGRLIEAGFTVPPGMVLTTAAFGRAELLDELGADLGADTLAVRSSAVEEDGDQSSYAGQFETVLDVSGAADLADAVRRCWASAQTDRVRAYGRGRGETPTSIAVLLQRQVDADVAGIAFTADPISGDRHKVLVSVVPGLGSGAVSGALQPDEWSVEGALATPLHIEHQALTAAQATAVAGLARKVEAALGGGPQDVEWAMADGQLLVLQARPITGLPQAPRVELPEGTWLKETERHPEPLTAFGASLAVGFVANGLSSMFARYGGLLQRMEVTSIGGEIYSHPVPFGGKDGAPPSWWLLGALCRVMPPLRGRMRSAKQMLRPGVLENIADEWWTSWRPELQHTVAELRAVDLSRLEDAELAHHVYRVRAEAERAMRVHFEMIPPYLVPVHHLVETCSQLLGWTAADALTLLSGTSDTTSAPIRALAALSSEIRTDAPARAAVLDPGPGLTDRLTSVSPELAASYTAWCDTYGYRNVNNDPGSPLLIEMPWLLDGLLRDVTRAGADEIDRRAPNLSVDRARAALSGSPARDRDAFEQAYASAARAYPLREDIAFSGSCFGGLARLAVLETGRRLVAQGTLIRAEDAVHLPVDMCLTALRRRETNEVRAQVRRAVAERKWVRQHPGPSFRGAPPAALPDVHGLPREGRLLNAALLWMQQPAATRGVGPQDTLVSGVPAAPGIHTGPARIILSASDFDRLQPGDVLVCPTTDPAWTLLFGTAGALITDGGGVLSHGAIVARESAIPAVVGTTNATTVLDDGQVITVDGASGTVTTPAPTS